MSSGRGGGKSLVSGTLYWHNLPSQMHLKHSGLRSSHLKCRRLQVEHPVRVFECRFLKRVLGTVDVMLIILRDNAIMREPRGCSVSEICGPGRDEAYSSSTFVSSPPRKRCRGPCCDSWTAAPIHVLGPKLGPNVEILTITTKTGMMPQCRAWGDAERRLIVDARASRTFSSAVH